MTGRIPRLMLQGTGSDVGKSLLTAGLCRAFTRRGLRVRPFKPQNMSNNAAVTADGGEIGRAQALQARACGVPPSRHMNPVLLKPQTDVGAQVVVRGEVRGNASARDYHALKKSLLPAVLESFHALEEEADLILVEGAGSPAEVNLRAADIANMGFAEAADLPVVLVGDIDRGGVIASIVGTQALLSGAERERLKGYIVNRFRGDPSLFTEGLEIITQKTGLPSFGLVPWFADAAKLPAEDGVALERKREAGEGTLRIAVPRLSRIANFDDFDPLLAEPDVALTFVEPGNALPGDAHLIILPGSKATLADLDFLKAQGWDGDLKAHVRRGGTVLGVCAGYQMLGRTIADPLGLEGSAGEAEGLGLLDVKTVMGAEKTLTETTRLHRASGSEAKGYEMHMGRTEGPALANPWLGEGSAFSAEGRVMGCYLHGLFAADGFRRAFLQTLQPDFSSDVAYEMGIEETLDALAAHLERHMDIDALLALARQGVV